MSHSSQQTNNQLCLVCGAPLPEPRLCGQDMSRATDGLYEIAECTECGLGTTLPLLAEDELHLLYPRDYVPHHLPTGLLGRLMDLAQTLRMRQFPVSRVREMPPGRALDVGCGRGDLGAWMIGHGWQVSGIEPDPEAAQVARSRGLDVHTGLLSDAVFNRPFDLIIWRHALEHTADPIQDLSRAARLLSPGGEMLLSMPNFSSWQRHFFRSRWFPLELPRHRTHMTPLSLRLSLERAGLSADIRTSTSLTCFLWSCEYLLCDRLLSRRGWRALLGYGAAVLLWPLAKTLDLLFRGGDFLHARASLSSGEPPEELLKD